MEKQTVETELVPAESPRDIAKLRKLATDAINQHQKAVKAYWALCVHIRDAQLTPDVVQRELGERGFAASRISEIKRVAFCAPALFEEYRQGVVGFRFVLGKARDGDEAAPSDQEEIPEVLKAEDKLRKEISEALEGVIPLTGPLPKLLRYSFPVVVNGYEVTLKIKKTKETAKK